MAASSIEPFDALYRSSDDPWKTTSRWYERRKRDLVLASLPRPRYASAYDAGCGSGALTAALAERCDRVLATDASRGAVDSARRALGSHQHVEVAQRHLPDDWPDARFDLVVVSELVYFLEADDQARLAVGARASAGDDGLVLACHWRDPIEGFDHRGDEAHRHFGDTLGLPRLYRYEDDDFVLDAWSRDTRSVGRQEGLR